MLAAAALAALLIPIGAPAASCPPANEARNCCCCCVCVCDPCGTDDEGTEDPAPEEDGQVPADYSSADLRFSELFPNPVGTDSENEFIELVNEGVAAVSLAGWELRDDKGRSFVFDDMTITSGAKLAAPYSETKIPLPNGGGKLTLHDPNGVERNAIEYGTPVPEGSTYASFGADWSWTTTPTPDADNVLTTPEEENAPEEDVPAEEVPEEETADEPEPVAVMLSEVMPNPTGDDVEGEWIELYNPGADADLTGWILDDAEGGSNPYVFPEGTTATAGGYLTVPRPSSKLALNNDEDSVRLFAPDGTLVDSADYADAKEGEAFARGAEGWSWTATPTPGSANEFPAAAEDEAEGEDGAEEADNEVSSDEAVPETIPVEAAHDLPDGTEVKVIGVVTLPPGVIGKTVFGLQDTDTDYGTTVRIYGDTVPALAEGDLVTVTGKIMRKTNGELRINSSASGIEILGGGEVTEKDKEISELDSGAAGLAVSIEGTVADIGRGWFIITDDSASHELKVELPEGQTYDFESGDRVTVSGVIRTESSTLALAVLGTDDIVAVSVSDAGTDGTAGGDSSQTLAAETENVTGLLPFLTVGAIGAGGVAYRGLRGRNAGSNRKKRGS